MKEIKERIESIIENASDKAACKKCSLCKDGCCTFGCVNERNGNRYNFSNKRITTPDYCCDNYKPVYSLSENTLDTLRDLLKDIERVNEGKKNLDLMLSGKITEEDFIDMMK